MREHLEIKTSHQVELAYSGAVEWIESCGTNGRGVVDGWEGMIKRREIESGTERIYIRA